MNVFKSSLDKFLNEVPDRLAGYVVQITILFWNGLILERYRIYIHINQVTHERFQFVMFQLIYPVIIAKVYVL